jgi:RimJ/RimL family protein N-acetyltransferase
MSGIAGDAVPERVSAGPPSARLFGREDSGDPVRRAGTVVPASGGSEGGRMRGASPWGAPRLLPSPETPRFPRSIETQRLVLELPRVEDLASVLDLTGDPSMFRYSERAEMSREEGWSLLLRHIGHWLVMGYGVYAVREKAGGRFAGLVGASSFNRRLNPRFDHHPEMTWTIAPQFRGRGYATEAAAAAIEALEAQPTVKSTVCLIHVDNQPSLGVASRLGFRFFRYCEYRGYPAGLFCR